MIARTGAVAGRSESDVEEGHVRRRSGNADEQMPMLEESRDALLNDLGLKGVPWPASVFLTPRGVSCPLPRSDRILGRMLPNCHPIGGCLLHREFGKRTAWPRIFTPHPAQGSFSYPATTPPLPHAGRITIFAEAWSEWASSDGFTAAPRNGSRLRNGSS